MEYKIPAIVYGAGEENIPVALDEPAFVQMLRPCLRIGGLFHMATDWQNYAEHMLEVMQQAEGFSNTSDFGDYVPRPDSRPLTKFERRGHRLGHGVWDLIFKRVN